MSEIPKIKVTVPNAPKMSVSKDSDEWDEQLKLKEDKENKITEIGEASTDEEYPSAKAVKAYVDSKGIKTINVSDIDNITTTGIYNVIASDGMLCVLVVVRNSEVSPIAQYYMHGDLFEERKQTSNGWTEWSRHITSEEYDDAIIYMTELLSAKEDVANKIDDLINYDLLVANGEYPTASAVINLIDNQLSTNMANVFSELAAKEDVSKKLMAVDDDGSYYSAQMTDMRISQELEPKADKSTTLSGYGITDAYTKAEHDKDFSGLNTRVGDLESNVANVSIKVDEVDTKLTDGYYTKTEVDNAIQSAILDSWEVAV